MLTTILEALSIFQTVFTLLPQLIKEFEVPGAAGPDKKNAVLEVVKGVLEGLNTMGLKVPTTVILTLASGAIDAIVAGFNLVGVFKKKPTA